MSARIEEELINKLKGFAYYRRISITEVIEKALVQFFKRTDKRYGVSPLFEGRLTPGKKVKL